MAFSSTNQPANRKPRGKSKKGKLADETEEKAIEMLNKALEVGEPWAIQLVIDRTVPKLKAVTPPDSLDGEYIMLKMKEISEFEERLSKLEAGINEGLS